MAFYGAPAAVIGHRGSGKTDIWGDRKPLENTAESLILAVKEGADGVEIDVQRTADDALVVYHNARTPDDRRIYDVTFAELSERYAIASLNNIMAAVPAPTAVNIEIKTGYDAEETVLEHEVAELVLDYLARAKLTQPIVVSCFDPTIVKKFAATEHVVGLLVAPVDVRTREPMRLHDAASWASELGAQLLHAHTEQFPLADELALERSIADVHGAGLELLVWCPKPKHAVHLLNAGADAVCVNYVAETVAGRGR
ncbi:MAG: glycerophosphodiester phosphodiesterase [Corynebacteriales bacterium]|nr:glycerophosphodiester phosphodiesterase [Mycobacteriales bacterium]